MSTKDPYRVKMKEHILDGEVSVEVFAGCIEEAEQKAKEVLSEWLDKKDLTILNIERIRIDESKINKY